MDRKKRLNKTVQAECMRKQRELNSTDYTAKQTQDKREPRAKNSGKMAKTPRTTAYHI